MLLILILILISIVIIIRNIFCNQTTLFVSVLQERISVHINHFQATICKQFLSPSYYLKKDCSSKYSLTQKYFIKCAKLQRSDEIVFYVYFMHGHYFVYYGFM